MGNVLVPYGPGLEVETGYTQQYEELIYLPDFVLQKGI